MNPPRAVLFDLDCRLVDRRASITRYSERFMSHFGRHLDPGADIVSVLTSADGAGYRAAERPMDIVDGLNWRTPPSADEVDRHWREHFPTCAVAMPDTLSTLNELRQCDYALGLVTNGSEVPRRRNSPIWS